jgi:hypothetical protein
MIKRRSGRPTTRIALVVALLLPLCALAQDEVLPPDRSGKLLLTGGVSQVEGSGGGGLTPWALIGGYGTRDQIGGSAHYTRIELDDYRLDSYGAALGLYDRVELSVAKQRFDTREVGAALGLGRGFAISQDIVGVKLRLLGDAVFEQDRLLPQISLGLQHKRNNRGDLLAAIGAGDDSGTDVYLSATKLWLDRSLLLNATLRYTEANQFGLLGFGGDRRDGRRMRAEGSVAVLLHRTLALGAEYRSKPDNLNIAAEDAAWDVFVAWAPNKTFALTLAYVDLGNIVIADQQRGLYASLQVGF